MCNRVVALIDMDCFYCQVEERLNPELKGQPTVVVQYNPWKGGGIIAVNYEARAQGVKRGMRGEQAKHVCPDVVLCSVPMIREKADLTRYRDAGKEIIDVMCKFSECVERASIDEAYVDLTSVVDKRLEQFSSFLPPSCVNNTFVVGYSDDSSNDEDKRVNGTATWIDGLYSSGLEDIDSKKLAIGAVVVEEMRKAIFDETGFKCSAGIAHNKILAKLAAGMHKPNKQTILPHTSIPNFYSTLPIYKVRNLGGKLGRDIEEEHNVKVMSDLLKFTKEELTKLFNQRMGNWLYNIARGFDMDPVSSRLMSKSIACCKNFPGKMSLSSNREVEHWMNKLTEELLERLLIDENMYQRKAQGLVFSVRVQEKAGSRSKETALSKSLALSAYSHDKIANLARSGLKKFCTLNSSTNIWSPIITFMGLSAGKFVDSSKSLNYFFDKMKRSAISEEGCSTPVAPTRFVNNGTVRDETISIDDDKPNVTSKIVNEEVNIKTNTTLDDSQFDESGGPSFFEKCLISDKTKLGQVKLNILPGIQLKRQMEGVKSPEKPSNSNAQKIHSINSIHKMGPEATLPNQKPISKSKDSISSLFMTASSKWVDPLEIFPDLENIDYSILEMFPLPYRKKIVSLLESRFGKNVGKSVINCDEVDVVSKKTNPSTSSSCTLKDDLLSKEISQPDASISQNQAEPSNSVEECAATIKCPKCSLSVSSHEYNEHQDYHFALSLQEEEQPMNNHSIQVSFNNNKPFKRKNPSDNVKNITKKIRGIDSYFKKSV